MLTFIHTYMLTANYYTFLVTLHFIVLYGIPKSYCVFHISDEHLTSNFELMTYLPSAIRMERPVSSAATE